MGEALLAAGLVEDLSPSNGLSTVMAPTNDAFSKLGNEVLGCLLQPQYVDDLQNVLMYHVANGEVLADQLVNDQEIQMLNEDNILITIGIGSRTPSSIPTIAPTASRAPTDVPTIAPIYDDYRRSQRRKIIEADNTVVINLNSEVVQPDMIASNGIGHGINRVLIPSGTYCPIIHDDGVYTVCFIVSRVGFSFFSFLSYSLSLSLCLSLFLSLS